MLEFTGMNNFLVSQIFAGLAIVFDTASFQLKTRRFIVASLAISSSLMASHYFLLNKNIAGLLVLISLARFITAYFSQHKYFISAFLLLSTFTTIYFYKAPIDLLVYIGAMVSTISAFQKNDKKLRQIMMLGTVFFIIYNILITSPTGALVEAIFLGSNLVGYYRHYLRK